MEMGSSSLAESGSFSASSPAIESVNGLNFGKKVYFENVNGATGKSGTESSSSGSRGPFARKARSGKQQQQQQQPPSCQVEGCKVDLSDAKPYYSRHRVCGMHSKSPKVIVAGLEQRFCQQCSRFHQLPEFDQGKRSCRRRLAGHNERRRKPPPGSLLSSRDGRFSSTTLGNMNRAGGFLLDFSAYPRPPGRDVWLSQRSSERVRGGQTTGTGRSFVQPWQNSSQTAQSNIYLQGSSGGTGSSGSRIPSGECFPGVNVADSSCALSLLSNQPWGPRNRASGLQVNNLADVKVAPMAQSTAPHDSAANWYPSPSWGFKGNEVSSSSHEMCPSLGLGQISQPLDSQFSSEPRLAQGNNRACDSSAMNMHWSL